jgi:hypothetical protein
MRKLFCIILLYIFGLPMVSFSKGKSPRYYEHISIKKLSHNHSNIFDTIEITAYLIRKEQYANHNIPEIRNYGVWINGVLLFYGDDHKIIITSPCALKISFIDDPPYRAIFNDFAIYGTNGLEGDTLEGFFRSPIVYYTVPSFQLQTKVNENKIALNFNYDGRMPIPYGNYLFKDTIPFGFTLEDYYIRRVEWFKDGKSISNSDKELTVTSPGKYYAQVTSNYDYPYTSDTISFTNEQLGIITECIDELIADRNVSISKGEYGYENELKEQLKVYPNPFIDDLKFNISVCNSLNLLVELYSIEGSKVYSKAFTLEKQEKIEKILSLDMIPNGIYFLTIYANEFKTTSKVIKN